MMPPSRTGLRCCMSISDEERRNVAANIRSAAERRKYDLQDDPDYDPFAALYCVFCGVRGFPRYKDILHLADLIDRSTTTRHGRFKTKYGRETPCCEVCGYSIGDMRWNHCPKCGAAIVDD